MDTYNKDFTLKWHTEHSDELDAIVSQSIREELGGLKDASELFFHHVFLGEDYDKDPHVFIWGEEDDIGVFHCKYVKEPDWEATGEQVAGKPVMVPAGVFGEDDDGA